MCKAKGSPTGEKKPAEIEYQKAVKIAGHQGIMRTLEAFKDFILLAFENNKHACRWLKNIHWPDLENVIADYKQQAEILKANIKKQGKPLPVQQKSPEKAQEEVKMKEHIQERRKSVLSRLNAKELEFTYFLRKDLINNFSSHVHSMWIENLVFSCKNGIALIGVESDTGVKLNWEKIERLLRKALQGKFEFTEIKWKLIN
jgi:ribosomal protein S17E